MAKIEKQIVYNVLMALAFLVLVLELFHLQVYEHHKYFQYSEKNRIRRLVLQPTRGLIYDQNGNVLVDNQPSYTLYAVPYECSKNDSAIALLAKILKSSQSEIKAKLKKREGPFAPVRIRRDVDFETRVEIEERKLELPGFFFNVEPRRLYPAGINAAHLFGYLGQISRSELLNRKSHALQQGDLVGKKGLEKVYDNLLRGQIGYNYIEVDALGREVEDVTFPGEHRPRPGNDFYLTIDLRLQRLAEDLFKDKKGGLVLINVRDGGVLSLCSKPDYNPDLFTKRISGESWRQLVNDPDRPLYDRMIQSVFPPGSTFKLVLAAAGLETRKCTPSTTSVCKGFLRLGRRNFKCWKLSGHGKMDLLNAIKHSCNVYFYRLSLKVGVDTWADFARKFGFGKPTGIDLLGESAGLVPDTKYLDKIYGKGGWTKGLLLNLGIGQGDLLVTPLQMAQFAMIMANSGKYYQPHLVHKMYDRAAEKMVYFTPREKKVSGVSQETFSILREGMFKVVNEAGGTGRASWLPDVTVAGKTGTAQNPHGDSHAWYIGFAPYDDPQIAICVFVENGGGGGAHAAPIAGKMFRAYFDNLKSSGTIVQR